ncbi:MAG: CHAP domain-containing protein [Flavobacteriales bacterium]
MLAALPYLLLATLAQSDTLPELNARIVAFALEQEGRKVDRGECWDLAAQALNQAGATWDGLYGFGRAYDRRKDAILPGDIMQFEGVTMETRTKGGMERFSFGKHTAIVVAVRGPGKVTIAHQNFGPTGRKVSQLELDLSTVTKGRILLYRPIQ